MTGLNARLALVFHLGAGDLLVSNAMVRDLAKHHEVLVVAVKPRYIGTAKFMWRDLPNVVLYCIEDVSELPLNKLIAMDFAVLLLGDNRPGLPRRLGLDWVGDLYTQAGYKRNIVRLGFAVQRDRCRELDLYRGIVGGEDEVYAFVHDDASRGFGIPPARLPCMRIVRPGLLGEDASSSCLFDYARIIELAQEVHVIDSAFSWLVELMGLHTNCTMHTDIKSGDASCRAVFRGPWRFVDSP